MRRVGWLFAVVGVVLSCSFMVRADEQAEGVKLVDAALKAMGGAAKVE